jgi:hypothetical protein
MTLSRRRKVRVTAVAATPFVADFELGKQKERSRDIAERRRRRPNEEVGSRSRWG